MTRPAVAFFAVALTACGASPPPSTPAAPTDLHDCRVDTDCVLVPIPCCGPCGSWNASQFESVRRESATARQHELCPEPVPCPECVVDAPPADITAACSDRRCVVSSPPTAPETS